MLFQQLISLLCVVNPCTFHDPEIKKIKNNKIKKPIASTKSGFVEGYLSQTVQSRSIYAFEGIPYGENTGGDNRYKDPIEKARWNGTLKTKSPGPPCLQVDFYHGFSIEGSEDCLFLNIYTPELGRNASLPTIVYIHGGSFYFDSGSNYGPAYLLDNDVVFVTLNYRLGILGFLSTGDHVIPGNYGLKDQRLALKWVSENIQGFGGDPTRVTIMGQSAGAASVSLHLLSGGPSRSYFSSAISLSGTALNPFSIMPKLLIQQQIEKISMETNCPYPTSEEFVNCLRQLNGRFLVSKFRKLFDVLIAPIVPLGPVIEVPGPNSFLTESPIDIYRKGGVANVPWIVSQTESEAEIFFLPFEIFGLELFFPSFTEVFWKFFAPSFLNYRYLDGTSSLESYNNVTRRINHYYFSGQQECCGSGSKRRVKLYSKMSSDRLFGYGIYKSLQLHSKYAPTYSLIYGYKGRNTLANFFGLKTENYGVMHTDDLSSYFNMTSLYYNYKQSDKEYEAVSILTQFIANFATSGKPTLRNKQGQLIDLWNPVMNNNKLETLRIDNDNVEMTNLENQIKDFNFWESLGLSDVFG